MQEKLNLAQYLHLINSHICLTLLFLFGHLWHASRAVFQDIWTGVTISSLLSIEYGRNEKLGNYTTKTSTF